MWSGPTRSPRGPASSSSRGIPTAAATCIKVSTTAAALARRFGRLDELGLERVLRRTILRQRFHDSSGHTGVTFVASTGDDGCSRRVSRLFTERGGRRWHEPLSECKWHVQRRDRLGRAAAAARASYETEPSLPSQASRAPACGPSPTSRSMPTPIPAWRFTTHTTEPARPRGSRSAAPAWLPRHGRILIAIANQGRVARGRTTLSGSSQTLSALYTIPYATSTTSSTGSNGGTFAAGRRLRRSHGPRHSQGQFARTRPGGLWLGRTRLVLTAQPIGNVTAGASFGLAVIGRKFQRQPRNEL